MAALLHLSSTPHSPKCCRLLGFGGLLLWIFLGQACGQQRPLLFSSGGWRFTDMQLSNATSDWTDRNVLGTVQTDFHQRF